MGKILIVDDSSTLRASVEYILTRDGHEVLQAEDGQKGLSLLQSFEGKEQEIGMIITDINMPNMDGISMIKEIKKLPLNSLPSL